MLVCFVCSKLMISLQYMKNHVRHHHRISKKLLICKQDDCRRRFDRLHSLYKHIRVNHLKAVQTLQVVTHRVANNKESREWTDEHMPECASIEEESVETLPTDNVEDSESELPSNKLEEISFILKLFMKPNLARSDVEDIIENTKVLLDAKLSTENHFEDMSTDYMIRKYLNTHNLYVEPTSLLLGFSYKSVRKGCSNQLISKPVTGSYLGITQCLYIFF